MIRQRIVTLTGIVLESKSEDNLRLNFFVNKKPVKYWTYNRIDEGNGFYDETFTISDFNTEVKIEEEKK